MGDGVECSYKCIAKKKKVKDWKKMSSDRRVLAAVTNLDTKAASRFVACFDHVWDECWIGNIAKEIGANGGISGCAAKWAEKRKKEDAKLKKQKRPPPRSKPAPKTTKAEWQ